MLFIIYIIYTCVAIRTGANTLSNLRRGIYRKEMVVHASLSFLLKRQTQIKIISCCLTKTKKWHPFPFYAFLLVIFQEYQELRVLLLSKYSPCTFISSFQEIVKLWIFTYAGNEEQLLAKLLADVTNRNAVLPPITPTCSTHRKAWNGFKTLFVLKEISHFMSRKWYCTDSILSLDTYSEH